MKIKVWFNYQADKLIPNSTILTGFNGQGSRGHVVFSLYVQFAEWITRLQFKRNTYYNYNTAGIYSR